MKILQPLFSFIVLLLIQSCTVGPNYHAPDLSLPPSYISQHNKTVAKHNERFWWYALKDRTLVKLINKALTGNNLDIQKAQAKIKQSRALLGISSADFYPQLNAHGKLVRDRLSANSELLSAFPKGLIPLSYTDYVLGFDASWELDFFGYTRRTVEASTARWQSQFESANDVVITTVAEVAKTYTQYRVYQQRISITKHNIASYAETARLVRLQYRAGSATQLDVKRIESQLLAAKALLPPLQADARAQVAALAVLVGEYPEDLYRELKRPAPIPRMTTQLLSVGLPSDLLRRRPDIRMAERELAAATADVGVAVANEFPRFQLAGNLGFDTVFPGTYWDNASRYWSIGPKFSLPIFQGGRLKQTVNAREAERDLAFAAYKKVVLNALAEVESSLVRYDQERLRKRNLAASLAKLKSAVRLVTLQYRSGQASLTDVLDVQREVDSINEQYAQSIGQVTVNLIALYKALGGGWYS